jgi:hypothetical protein
MSIPEDYLLCLNRINLKSEEEDIENAILMGMKFELAKM